MARVFGVQVQIAERIRVSRYNVAGKQETSHVTQRVIESSYAVWICLVILSCQESRNGLQKP